MKKKFLYRIFLFIFLSSLLSILLLTTIIYYKIREENYQIAYNQAYTVQQSYQDSLYSLIDDYERMLDDWCQNDRFLALFSDSDLSPIDIVYNNIYTDLHQKKYQAEVTILDSKQNILIETNREIAKGYLSIPNQWGIFRKMHESIFQSELVVHVPQKTPSFNNDIALSIAKPVYSQRKIVGYIIIDFPHQVFNEMYHNSLVPYQINLVLSDSNNFSFFNSKVVTQNNSYLSELSNEKFVPKSNILYEKETKDELILRRDLPNFGLIIYSFIPFETFKTLAAQLIRSLGLIILILFIVSGIVSYLLALYLYRPINLIMKKMKEVEKGALDIAFPILAQDEMSSIAEQFNRMMKTIRTLINNNKEKQEAIRLAEIKALQSQMKPHFLYNTLNSIKFMARLNGISSIDDMVTNLATLLRANISSNNEIETISETVLLIESYLTIQHYRYEDDLEYQIYVEEEVKDEFIPKLIVQPLVENSIEHGIEEKNGKGEVFLSIIKDDAYCLIIVEDNGNGIDSSDTDFFREASSKSSSQNGGNGIGLNNIYKRLFHYYGDQFEMNIYNVGGTSIIIKFPLKERLE